MIVSLSFFQLSFSFPSAFLQRSFSVPLVFLEFPFSFPFSFVSFSFCFFCQVYEIFGAFRISLRLARKEPYHDPTKRVPSDASSSTHVKAPSPKVMCPTSHTQGTSSLWPRQESTAEVPSRTLTLVIESRPSRVVVISMSCCACMCGSDELKRRRRKQQFESR